MAVLAKLRLDVSSLKGNMAIPATKYLLRLSGVFKGLLTPLANLHQRCSLNEDPPGLFPPIIV